MRRRLESGLMAAIGMACAAFVGVLVRGPTRAEELVMDGTGKRWSGDGVKALERDEVLGLPGGRQGSSVRVEVGTVVVTREGDPEDHVLAAGAVLRVPGRGRALAWALEPSRIEVRRGELADGRAGVEPARALVAP